MQISWNGCSNSKIARTAAVFVWTWTALAAAGRASAAEPVGKNGAAPAADNGRPEAAKKTATEGVRLPDLDGPKPWSSAPVLNAPDRFHIAIMTDRTGGHRPGIWMKGVRSVNMLRPEFVVSVGDLIEGYTDDEEQVEREWKEFLSFIEQMEMKFFFVAGNHDLSNPRMHDIWRKHFGREWYSFDYRNVHFVCLNSEDPETHLGEEQLAWLQDDLNDHANARWTLVFLHKPLWSYAEHQTAAGNPDPTGWSRAEEMLRSRPHTVFAGHVHHYVQFDRNGMQYYSLATTGGGSQLRGTLYGEFDHVTWLTMEEDGPHVANLLLDGILPAEVVTEKGITRFREFLAKTVVQVAPIWVDEKDGFSVGRIDLQLTNGLDLPIELSGKIEGLPLRGLSLEPSSLSLSAKPGEAVEKALSVRFARPVELQELTRTRLTATVKTTGGDRPMKAEWTVPVTIDRKYTLARRHQPAIIDALLDDWERLRFRTGKSPLVLGTVEHWQGEGDAAVSFDVAYDDDRLLFAARLRDDSVVAGDSVELWLDSRPLASRAKDHRLRDAAFSFHVAAPGKDASGRLRVRARRSPNPPGGSLAKSRKTENGYDVELAIPIALLKRIQGDDWKSVQLTVVINDVDESGQAPARVVWRGTNDLHTNNANYGQFVREE